MLIRKPHYGFFSNHFQFHILQASVSISPISWVVVRTMFIDKALMVKGTKEVVA